MNTETKQMDGHPLGAELNGREFFDRLRDHYNFLEENGHKLADCYEYQQARLCFEALVNASRKQDAALKAALEALNEVQSRYEIGHHITDTRWERAIGEKVEQAITQIEGALNE